jgi:hypothetical protein
MPTLTNRQIRAAGKAILTYRPRPTAREFHRSPAKFRFLLGGNRSGKSESNIGYDLSSFSLGLHPFRTTPPNAQIWACTINWEMVGSILWRDKLRKYIPASQIASLVWHNRAMEIPRAIQLVNGTRIEMKAFEQSREAFQGKGLHAAYLDEQIPSNAEALWQEIQSRLMDFNGFCAWSMTPLIFQEFLEQRLRDPQPTDSVHYMSLNENRRSQGGHVDDAEIDAMIREWPVEVQTTRIEGRFSSFVGSVYTTFSRDTHVTKPFEIPADWPRWRSIDFGYAVPFCCLWVARDHDRRFYLYREHYESQRTLSYHAERIKQISGRERYRATFADWDAQGRAELEDKGIKTVAARKDLHAGIEAVQRVLKVQGDGRPRLFIFENCKNTIREIQGYRWRTGSEHKNPVDEPEDVDNHAMDALRYAIFSIEGPSYFRGHDLS